MGDYFPAPKFSKQMNNGFLLLSERYTDGKAEDYQLRVHRFNQLKIFKNAGKRGRVRMSGDSIYWIFGVSNTKEVNLLVPQKIKKNTSIKLHFSELSNGDNFYFLRQALPFNDYRIELHNAEQEKDLRIYQHNEVRKLSRGIESFLYRAGIPIPSHDGIQCLILDMLGIDFDQEMIERNKLDITEAFRIVLEEEMEQYPDAFSASVSEKRKFDKVMEKL